MYWLPCSVLRDCILQVPLMSEGFSCHGLRVGESNYPRINVRCKVGENTHQSNVLANEDERSIREIDLTLLTLTSCCYRFISISK